MTAPHCGRLNDHEPHSFQGRDAIGPRFYECPGHVTTEGGRPCVVCQAPIAGCRCEAERAAREHDEWWDDAS